MTKETEKTKAKAEVAAPASATGVLVPTIFTPVTENSTGQLDLFAVGGFDYEVPKHYMQPSGMVSRAFTKTISLGEKLKDPAALATMKQRKTEISHSASIKAVVLTKNDTAKLSMIKGSKEVSINITSLKQLCGKNTGTMRIYKVLMGEIARQCLYNGRLVNGLVVIQKQLLLDLNIYSTADSALVGWKKATDTLKKMTFTATIKSSSKNPDYLEQVLFTGFGRIDNGNKLIATVNKNLDWGLIVDGLAYTPTWLLDQHIANNTFLLSDFIYDQIRIKKNDLKKVHTDTEGSAELAYFDMKLVNLQEVMNLPSCEAAKSNASRLVKKPIVDAVAEFNNTAMNVEDSQVKLSIIATADASSKDNTQQWLDNNRLRVYVQGRLLEEMEKLAVKQLEAIEIQMAKKEKKQLEAEKVAKNS